MELRTLIIQACNDITEDMCRRVINNITVRVLNKLPDVIVVILNTWFSEDKSPCNGLSFCMLDSNIVIEIKSFLIDQILDHFMFHPVCSEGTKTKLNSVALVCKQTIPTKWLLLLNEVWRD
jgi:predicted Zn-dependent protease with MMP-like domain